ncbi:hypothetical protein IJE86_05710 [bacterium]|nr:hypothetical protein [bacterium]
MRKLFSIVCIMGILVSLTACGLPGELGEVGKLIKNVDDFKDNIEASENSSKNANKDYDKWWESPFYLKGEWNSAAGYDADSEPEEIEACFDGEEFIVYCDPSYYVHKKDDMVYSFMLTEKINAATRFETKAKSVAEYVGSGAAYIPNMAYYTKSLNESPDAWKKVGSEKYEGFDCEIYECTESLIVYSTTYKVWFDKKTGMAVRVDKKTEYVDKDAENTEYTQYKLTSFKNSNVPKVSELFDLNDYGGDPDVAAAELKAKIPQPTVGTIKKEASSRSSYMIDMDWTIEDAKSYVEVVKNAGFTEEEKTFEYDTYYSFTAKNAEGCKVNVSDAGGINLYSANY